jgi:chemotaxis protein MotB
MPEKSHRGMRFNGLVGMLSAVMIMSCAANKKAQQQIKDLNESNAKLTTSNDALSKQVNDLNNVVSHLTEQNRKMTADFAEFRNQCQEIKEKYKDASDVLDRQEKILKQIEKKLEDALSDLQGRGLTVYHKRGLVFVSMEDKMLFKSGSNTLGGEGAQALSTIASVMNDYPDVKVIVVGNTDNVPSKKGSDNWTLSTERANSVVRVLRDTYKIDPMRLTSGGKGRFNPVADNDTVEGRAKNRRIDIVFNPDLDKLWESIEL